MRNAVGSTGNTTPTQWPGWSASGSPQQSSLHWPLLLEQKITQSTKEHYLTHAQVHLTVGLGEWGRRQKPQRFHLWFQTAFFLP